MCVYRRGCPAGASEIAPMAVQLSLFDLPFPSAPAAAPASVDDLVAAALARFRAAAAAPGAVRSAPPVARPSRRPAPVAPVAEVPDFDSDEDSVAVLAAAGLDFAVRVARCGSLAD